MLHGPLRMARMPAPAAAAAPVRVRAVSVCAQAAKVKFTLPKRVEFGQELAVIGSSEALGGSAHCAGWVLCLARDCWCR
jgi:hypothetical protein